MSQSLDSMLDDVTDMMISHIPHDNDIDELDYLFFDR
jgi:hypothetical protein